MSQPYGSYDAGAGAGTGAGSGYPLQGSADRRNNSPSPYYNTPPSSSAYMPSSAVPPYVSQQHLIDTDGQPSTQQYQRPFLPDGYLGPGSTAGAPVGGSSPFESVFDDHVYPANAYQSPRQHADTAYYGRGGSRTPSEELQPQEDIPLKNRAGKFDSEAPDHVYDAPAPAPERAVRFGELGMLGANRRRIPYVTYVFTVAQIAVFIAEIIRNAILTGSPIMIHPQFNPMIGPSVYVLINMGSRFVPCMHNVDGIQSASHEIHWPCPNMTTNDANSPMNMCTLSELCGFGGVPNPLYNGNAHQSPEPNQWFRFILPMFMHSGLIHIGFNLVMQLTIGRDMERSIGPIRYFLVYVSSGICGFVMGGNYAATGISSTGASGSLFGVIALTLLDLLYSWRDRRNPVKDLLFILLDVLISLVLGLLPGLDNFSHIGGFLMGLCLGISLLHSPNALRRRIGESTPYTSVNSNLSENGYSSFFRQPMGFFKDRKPLWWAWWLFRTSAIVIVIVMFVLLLNNFYIYHNTCSWCKYLSCLPVNNWCEIGNIQMSNTTRKRDLLSGTQQLANLF